MIDAAPPWLLIARAELGVTEYSPRRPGPHGELSNPRIEEYQHESGGHRDDDVPWCSSFACWVMAQAGLPHTHGTGARAWARWGVPLVQPRLGCVVVLWRESPIGRKGHVGFFEREDSKGIWLLAGNQGNAVSVKPFPSRRVLGFRWPAASEV